MHWSLPNLDHMKRMVSNSAFKNAEWHLLASNIHVIWCFQWTKWWKNSGIIIISGLTPNIIADLTNYLCPDNLTMDLSPRKWITDRPSISKFFVKRPRSKIDFRYDDIWKSTKQSAKGTVPDKLRVLEDGFERYMNEYFYVAKVFISHLQITYL